MTPVELSRFMGRLRPFAMQTPNGGYVPVHEKITIEHLEKHLKGLRTYGTYVIREDGLINFAVVDVDGKVGDDMKIWLSLGEKIMTLFPEFDRCLEFSGRRGYHIWVFPDQPEKPAFMKELVKSRLKAQGLRNIEVYPKQDKVDVLNKKLGNLIKLPSGKHLKGGWSKILRWEKKNE